MYCLRKNLIRIGPIGIFLLSGRWASYALWGVGFLGDFGRYWEGQNWDRIFEKTRVGFGRTELSLRLSCTEFRALSSGHGPRGQGFEGEG